MYTPFDLPKVCDVCEIMFTVGHILQCRKDGFVIVCHNDIIDNVDDLFSMTWGTSVVHDEQFFN